MQYFFRILKEIIPQNTKYHNCHFFLFNLINWMHLLRVPNQNGKAAGKEVGIFLFFIIFRALFRFFPHPLWDFSEGQLVRKSLAVLWKKEFVLKIKNHFLVIQSVTVKARQWSEVGPIKNWKKCHYHRISAASFFNFEACLYLKSQ